MKTIYRLAFLFVASSGLVYAQEAPVPQPATGTAAARPTMEQTIGFINQAFADRGQIAFSSYDPVSHTRDIYGQQSVKLQAACSLEFTQWHSEERIYNGEPADYINNAKFEAIQRFLLKLDSSNIPDISVLPNKMVAPTMYWVSAVAQKQLPYNTLDQKPAPIRSSEYSVYGSVHSVSGSTIAVVTKSGKLVSFELKKYADITHSDNESSIVPGEFIHVFALGKSQQVYLSNKDEAGRLGPFPTEDAAKHVARALIHALVLCHKDAPSSLF